MAFKDLGKSLIDTVMKAGATELLADYGEIGLDAVTTAEVLKEVPVLGTLIKLGKIGSSIRDYRFAKSLYTFLLALNKTSDSDRVAFSARMNDDKKVKEKVGEILITFIDRFDESEKTEMLAKAFQAFLQSAIDLPIFIRMGRSIDRCMCSDLEKIPDDTNPTTSLGDSVFDLAGCGLIEIRGVPTIGAVGTPTSYQLTEFGKQFRAIVLERA